MAYFLYNQGEDTYNKLVIYKIIIEYYKKDKKTKVFCFIIIP